MDVSPRQEPGNLQSLETVGSSRINNIEIDLPDGTKIRYTPTCDDMSGEFLAVELPGTKSHKSKFLMFHSISAMKEYCNYSFEELRFRDYEIGQTHRYAKKEFKISPDFSLFRAPNQNIFFPEDILSQIFQLLSISSLWEVSKTCIAWRQICEDSNQRLWRLAVFRTYYSTTPKIRESFGLITFKSANLRDFLYTDIPNYFKDSLLLPFIHEDVDRIVEAGSSGWKPFALVRSFYLDGQIPLKNEISDTEQLSSEAVSALRSTVNDLELENLLNCEDIEKLHLSYQELTVKFTKFEDDFSERANRLKRQIQAGNEVRSKVNADGSNSLRSEKESEEREIEVMMNWRVYRVKKLKELRIYFPKNPHFAPGFYLVEKSFRKNHLLRYEAKSFGVKYGGTEAGETLEVATWLQTRENRNEKFREFSLECLEKDPELFSVIEHFTGKLNSG